MAGACASAVPAGPTKPATSATPQVHRIRMFASPNYTPRNGSPARPFGSGNSSPSFFIGGTAGSLELFDTTVQACAGGAGKTRTAGKKVKAAASTSRLAGREMMRRLRNFGKIGWLN
jgi:hypothetical protein